MPRGGGRNQGGSDMRNSVINAYLLHFLDFFSKGLRAGLASLMRGPHRSPKRVVCSRTTGGYRGTSGAVFDGRREVEA